MLNRRAIFYHTEIEYLGLWITCNGVQPVNEKIKDIIKIAPPEDKQVI